MNVSTRNRIKAGDLNSRPTTRRGTRFGAFVLLAGLAALPFSGCGDSSKSAAPVAADPAPAKAEEQPAEAAPEKPALKRKKKGAAEKAVVAEAPKPNQKDPMKWQVADLKAGLAQHDAKFLPAVLMYSVQNPNGDKPAAELRALLEQAGKMKDDPAIPLPLPANSAAKAGLPASPAVAAAAAAASSTNPPTMRKRRKKDD